MGPPKKRPRKLPYSEVKRRYDCFEYRWDSVRGSYYLFNPYTGETIFSTNLEMLNRNYSMWAKPDKYPSKDAQTIQLFPETYASRRWGRRRFQGWSSPETAAIHMTAVARGFLARNRLRKIYKARYCLMIDQFSGYYYIVDNYLPDNDTLWYKPRLAFPGDIQLYVPEDPDDYMKNKRYSQMDFKSGPLIKVSGLSKYDPGRTDVSAFFVHNPERDIALRKYDEIDLDNIAMGETIVFMDGHSPTHLEMSEYHTIRAAICGSNWTRVVEYMKAYEDNLLIQLYGFQSFSKTSVPMDSSGVVDYAAQDATELCIQVIQDPEQKYSQLHKIFAMRAFHNIFHIRAARAEYLNQELVTEQGEFRAAAVEDFLKARLGIFNQYLVTIPNETINMYEKGEKDPHPIVRPLPRSVEVVEIALECMCLLAQEIESKEVLAFVSLQPLMHAVEICHEHAGVIAPALKFLYNLCYRCESGQEAILVSINVKQFLAQVRHEHSGDFDVMRQCRRLELALAQDGWRGNVEQLIAKEMRNEEIDEEYLRPSTYGVEGYTAT